MQIDAPSDDRSLPRCGIAMMAKASKAGRTKTRLGAVDGFEQAALLNTAFLKKIAENLTAARTISPIAGYVAFAPGPDTRDRFEHPSPACESRGAGSARDCAEIE